MATKYKLFGVLQNGDKCALFNGATFSQKQNAIKRLEAAANKNKLSEFTKILFQEIKFFERGARAAAWPDGQTTDITFDVMDGKIPLEKIKSVLIKEHKKDAEKNTSVRYFYETNYPYLEKMQKFDLAKNVTPLDFVKHLRNVKFGSLSFVLLTRETTDLTRGDKSYREIMLYNITHPGYDMVRVIESYIGGDIPDIRYINKNDIPMSENMVKNWVKTPDNIPTKLVKFLRQNER